jgi:hypothetical protein
MKINRVNVMLFILPLVLMLAAWAQATRSLSGTVLNAEGASVPNAAVTVTPVNGGTPQRVLTGSDGKFTITGLPEGAYKVEVEYSGYKRTAVQNIDLGPAAAADIRVELQRGDTRETVEVQARAVLIQTESGETANSLDIRTVSETPVFDRNHQQLVNLVPGITPPYTNPNPVLDPQQNRLWETNGLSNAANRRNLDGVENDEPFNGGAVFVTPLQAVQQLDLITSNYDAQSGRAAGTILNPVTRSGSNGIHGSLFEFNSNNAMAARNFFDPKGYPQSRFTINQTGASVGGPIKRDTTFFLIDFEADLNRSQTPIVTTVPTADLRSGNFSGVPGLSLYNPNSGLPDGSGRSLFPNNMIPASQISSVSRSLLPFIPMPNSSGLENNLAVNVPVRNDGYRGDVRLDHKIGEINLFARGSYADYSTAQGSALGVLGGSTGHLQTANAMIGMTQNLSPSLTTDVRLGYTRYSNKLNVNLNTPSPSALGFGDPSASLLANAGFTNLGLPQIQINGMQSFGTQPGYPQYNTDNNWNLINGWHKLIGRHDIHFGFDIYYIRSNGFQNFAFGPEGGFLFGPGATASPTGTGLGPYGNYANSLAGFLVGAPTEAGRNLPAFTPGYSTWQASGYLADTVKLTDRLTVDIGARYDVFTPPAARYSSGVFMYNPTSNQLIPATGSGFTGNMETNFNNIAPRIGIAYRPLERTVIRAGYGINFFQGPLNFYASSLLSNVAIANGGLGTGFARAGTFDQLPSLASLTTVSSSPIPAPNSPLAFSPNNVRTPYVQNFDFLIQHDVGKYGLIASVGYVGNLGRELPYSLETNAAAAGAGVNGQPLNTPFGRTASTIERLNGLTSNYNSLQANLTKRFSQSLSFTMAYTYSRALDYGGGLNPLLNNLNVRSNYGPADWDRTHMFTLSHVWRLPIGADSNFLHEGLVGKLLGPWQIDGIFTWVSGTPFTLTADPTLCNCPGNTPTASTIVTGTSTTFIPVPTFFGFLPIPYRSLNFAYTQPPPNSFGNLGRNSVRGPGFANYNVSLFRSFVLHEQARLEFRAEAYNLANTAHFANPIANVSDANFGQSISTLNYDPERRLQVAVRILF